MSPNRREFLKQISVSAAGLGFVPWFAGCRTGGLLASRDLPRSTPEAQGVASAGIQAFLDALGQSKHEFHGFVMARHGHVIAEGWWAPYAPQLNHMLYSMSKSFTSTAVGFAVSEGKMRVTDPVVSFFPHDLPAQVSDNLATMRVKDLLTMSAGHAKEPTWEMIKEENWVKAFLAWPVENRPGTNFLYNSAATYMLSAIVQQVTGQRVFDYLTPRLFDPLHIEGAKWDTCPRGINVGGWGLNVPTEALAKFGQLYLQKGVWRGKQILPASWVEEATTFKIQQPAPAKPSRPKEQNDWQQGYCYQFWRSTHNSFRGDGAFGQYTLVLPEQDVVIAINSETSDMQGELDLVWQHLLPACQPKALPRDADGQRRLSRTLASLALKAPQGEAVSPTARLITDRNCILAQNELRFRSALFSFGKPDSCRFVLRTDKTAYQIFCGINRWQFGETDLPGTPPNLVPLPPKPGTKFKVATSGRWKDANTFEMTLRYYETPHHDTVTCHFDGEQATISFMSSIAAMSATPKDKRPALQGKMAPAVATIPKRKRKKSR